MAFNRPTLAELIERTNTDMASRIRGRSAVLRRSVIGVLSRAAAGLSHMLHGHLDYNAEQLLPDTADDEHLARWASIWKVKRGVPTYARGPLLVSGANGSVMLEGTVWQADDGTEYVTDADATIDAGEATVSLTAKRAGRNGNLDPGITLSRLATVSGIDGSAEVGSDGITGGSDQESIERWRERVLKRIQNPPQGGADVDYEQWALEVADVTRAWVYRNYLGAGTVGIAVVCDDLDDIIPSPVKVEQTQSHVDVKRPVTAEAVVFAPTGAPIDFVFSKLSPNTAAVRSAVQAELADMIKREAAPGGTIRISWIREAISIAAGENDYVLDSPSADVTHSNGVMPEMGNITWP